MNLKDYVLGLPPKEREAYAKRSGTTLGYLQLVMGGHRKAGTDLSRKLSDESGGVVELSDLRPDVWPPGYAA